MKYERPIAELVDFEIKESIMDISIGGSDVIDGDLLE